ncbi:MAG: nuclear transport factor 2 family protein [Candidatus Aminicenantes bacterium]|nr:nuclear transport factor 2 family protein [Candidatus Aminicenantes bacterium]
MPKSSLFRLLVFLLSGVAVTVQAQTDKPERDLDSLIAAERAFSKMSGSSGMRTAFLANLAPQAIVLQPRPVPGRPVYEKIPPEYPAVLTWQPVVAEVSAAGDLGWTSGPYEIRPVRDYQGAPGVGHYISVWGRKKDGVWKVLIDGGIGHPAPETAVQPDLERLLPAVGSRAAFSPSGLDREKRTLIRRDESFSSRVEAVGFAGAYLHEGADDIRLYLEGEYPILGKDEVKAKLAGSTGSVTLVPAGAEVSESGDLGYSYGTGTMKGMGDKPAEIAFGYIRIWRKAVPDRWRLCLDLMLLYSSAS